MNHVVWPDPAPLRPVVYNALPLADEGVEQNVPVVIHDANAGKRGFASFRPYADHLAVHSDVFSRSMAASDETIMRETVTMTRLTVGGWVSA